MQLGVIEGFFGRSWSQAARLDTIAWLADNAYAQYIYAPKGDALLRAQWQLAGDCRWVSQLKQMADSASVVGLQFGVGLSPLGAVKDFSNAAREALHRKLAQLDDAGVQVLAILFDDMCCEFEDLAQRQLRVIDFILEKSQAQHFVVCPSYYSFDPVLARVFGDMPTHYWSDFGNGLASDVDVLWTGNEVCSPSINQADIEAAVEALGRVPILWDNYPVNDGEKACQYLHLRAFSNRDALMQNQLAGHWVNPMNQCYLSRVAMASLPQLYREGAAYNSAQATERQIELQCKSIADLLKEDLSLLSEQGLQSLSLAQVQLLQQRYANNNANPAAVEVLQWLAGEYAFDPACLTEV